MTNYLPRPSQNIGHPMQATRESNAASPSVHETNAQMAIVCAAQHLGGDLVTAVPAPSQARAQEEVQLERLESKHRPRAPGDMVTQPTNKLPAHHTQRRPPSIQVSNRRKIGGQRRSPPPSPQAHLTSSPSAHPMSKTPRSTHNATSFIHQYMTPENAQDVRVFVDKTPMPDTKRFCSDLAKLVAVCRRMMFTKALARGALGRHVIISWARPRSTPHSAPLNPGRIPSSPPIPLDCGAILDERLRTASLGTPQRQSTATHSNALVMHGTLSRQQVRWTLDNGRGGVFYAGQLHIALAVIEALWFRGLPVAWMAECYDA